MVIALLMAGGKGTRMNSTLEKPMTTVNGKTLIGHVLSALQGSSLVDEIIVATSPHSPETTLHIKNLGFRILETPGKGYVEDLSFILSHDDFQDEIILTITADLPLITGEIIDLVLEEYQKSSLPAMSVMVPVEIFREHDLQASLVLENLVPSGLNILRGKDTEQDEEVLVLDKIELALNINSPEDIICLEKLRGNSRR
ncbi:MAG: NTP transferase domain-containing protein [Methanobacterium sp.]|jgi:adenosylcobinamide-phosphate guanylyltransferase|uniref:NTP transferase domain-containing protein n=1 Tax=Methanobacterium sp. TaxID=2164 RepID=UPI00258984B0|nr:NTP transferase domain-containing protein [Methanobacterium sp.]MCC7559160.1 NTP transferase domain-containing protein [Methanobacterium sp.]